MIPSEGPFQAVVFDMDGVLIDARDWHFRALNDALEIFGTSISYEDHIARFDGLPTRVKLNMLTDEGLLPGHVHTLINAVKQERTLREAASLCFPRIEHLLLLGWLRQQGLRVAVATNSIRETASTMLNFAGILPSIECLVTNEDVARAKPFPDIYLRTSEILALAPRDLLVVEDHPYGVAAAEAAGCTVVQVSSVKDVTVDLIERVLNQSELSDPV